MVPLGSQFQLHEQKTSFHLQKKLQGDPTQSSVLEQFFKERRVRQKAAFFTTNGDSPPKKTASACKIVFKTTTQSKHLN